MRVEIDANAFKRLINNTKKFLGYAKMQYICLEFTGDEVIATALDGYRVSKETAKIRPFVTEPFKCYIKPNIPKITHQDRYAELELIDNRLLVTVGDNITGFVQPKEPPTYPVKSVIDNAIANEVKASVWVNPKLLKEALESCEVLNRYQNFVKLEICGKREPIKIWYGERDNENNIKLVLPVNHSD